VCGSSHRTARRSAGSNCPRCLATWRRVERTGGPCISPPPRRCTAWRRWSRATEWPTCVSPRWREPALGTPNVAGKTLNARREAYCAASQTWALLPFRPIANLCSSLYRVRCAHTSWCEVGHTRCDKLPTPGLWPSVRYRWPIFMQLIRCVTTTRNDIVAALAPPFLEHCAQRTVTFCCRL
jgi:hypothetical protein